MALYKFGKSIFVHFYGISMSQFLNGDIFSENEAITDKVQLTAKLIWNIAKCILLLLCSI